METKAQGQDVSPNDAKRVLADGFICQGCKHELPIDFNVRTDNYCYLCDPNITLEECLSDAPLERLPKAIC